MNALPELSLLEVPPGAQARVVDLAGMTTSLRESLLAYGLVPGCQVLVVQHVPVTVVQVDNTELALEAELARHVRVAELAVTGTPREGKERPRSRRLSFGAQEHKG